MALADPCLVELFSVNIFADSERGGGQRGPFFSSENATRVLCTVINYSKNKLLLTFSEI